MSISFIKYARPDGRRVPVLIDRPIDIEDKAATILAMGYVFEVEQLRTGDVSLTIRSDNPGTEEGEQGDLDIELVFVADILGNNEAIGRSVDKFVTRCFDRFVKGGTDAARTRT